MELTDVRRCPERGHQERNAHTREHEMARGFHYNGAAFLDALGLVITGLDPTSPPPPAAARCAVICGRPSDMHG